MVLCLLAQVYYNDHNGCLLSYTFRNGLIDSFEVFHSYTVARPLCLSTSLVIPAQCHYILCNS